MKTGRLLRRPPSRTVRTSSGVVAMHDPGVVILILAAGGVLLLAVSRKFAASPTLWTVLAAGILCVGAATFLSPVESPFSTLRGGGPTTVVWLTVATALALSVAEGTVGAEAAGIRSTGAPAALLLLQASGTLAAALGTTTHDVWFGLEVVSMASLAVRRLERSSDRERVHSVERTNGETSTLIAALLFAAAIAWGEPAIRPAERFDALASATPVGQGLSTNVPRPESRRDALSSALLIASLGLRLMAAPFHLSLWHIPPLRSYGRQSAWLTFGRAAPLIAWARLVALSPGSHSSGVVMTGVVAAASIFVGILLLAREVSMRPILNAVAMIQTGFVLTGLAAVGWISAHPEVGPPQGLAAIASRAWISTLIAESGVSLGVGLLLAALRLSQRSVETLDDLRGLARTAPWTGGLLVTLLLGMAGMPLASTFWGRLLTLGATWSVRRESPSDALPMIHPAAAGLMILTIAGWLTLVWHALRVVDLILWRGPLGRHTIGSRWPLVIAAVIATALVVTCLGPQIWFSG